MTGTTFLYNELVDMVIDHLHDDKSALTSCSLVSRSWVYSSQFHLFENMHLPSVTTDDGVEAFMRLVDSCPRIGYYVRTLRVDGEPNKHGSASGKNVLTPRHTVTYQVLGHLSARPRLLRRMREMHHS